MKSRLLTMLIGVGLWACAAPGAVPPARTAALGSGAPQSQEGSSQRDPVPWAHARRPLPNVLTGGAPTAQALEAAAASGYRRVVSLLPDSIAEQRHEVERVGMDFVSIPVGSPADLTRQNGAALARSLPAPGEAPVVVHCASGNRAGALLALAAHWELGYSVEDAMKLGHAAGLDSLSDAVLERLQEAP